MSYKLVGSSVPFKKSMVVKQKQKLREYYIKKHGRMIKGYCQYCGEIFELSNECNHNSACVLKDED